MKIYEVAPWMALSSPSTARRSPIIARSKQFTKRGFEWTYEGTSPQQLALAILFDYTGDRARAVALSEPFMKDVVANLDNDWQLTGEQVDGFLRGHRA